MKFILAKKIEMTQIWKGDDMIAVTKVQAGPCQITQLKTVEKDGYEAVQIGFGARKIKNINKPQIAHLKKAGVNVDEKKTLQYSREFRADGVTKDLGLGDTINTETFAVGDMIQVTATSKGKGFQGVVKRHHFKGTNEQHGNKDQSRMPGSIGAKGPAHVFKGTRMAGRMGNERVTITNQEIIEIDNENNILYIQGGVPGARNSLVLISGHGELKISTRLRSDELQRGEEEAPVTEVKTEEPKKVEKVEEVKTEEPKKVEKVEEVKAEEPKKVEEVKEVVPEATAETPEQVEKEVVEAKQKVEEAK